MKCLICSISTIKQVCFYNLFSNKPICCTCYGKFKLFPQIINYRNHHITILFKYNDVFRTLIKLWKLNKNPIALKLLASFIKKYIPYNKNIIYPPSFVEKGSISHLEHLFNYMKINNQNIFEKTQNQELKHQKFSKRKAEFNLKKSIPGNFLLIDDIYTSGSTIKRALDLLESQGYSHVKVIIFATTQKIK